MAVKDCTSCKEMNDVEQRQRMGCGFETPIDDCQMWVPDGFRLPPNDEKFPSVCPGYSVHLPEVVEVARARMHWLKGELSSFVEGRPSELLLLGIEIMDGSSCELTNAQATKRSEGGLATG